MTVKTCDEVFILPFIHALVVNDGWLIDEIHCGGSVALILGNGPRAGLTLLKGNVGSGMTSLGRPSGNAHVYLVSK